MSVHPSQKQATPDDVNLETGRVAPFQSCSLLTLVREVALFPDEGSDESAVPLHLCLEDYSEGLQPLGWIRESLGKSIQEIEASFNFHHADLASVHVPLLVYNNFSLSAWKPHTAGMQGECWTVPADVARGGYDSMTAHFKRLALICEGVYHLRKVTASMCLTKSSEITRLNGVASDTIPAKDEELMDTYGDPRSKILHFQPESSPRTVKHAADINAAFAFPRHCISSMKFSNYSSSAIGMFLQT
jgi:hypothetical protein